MNLCEVEFNFIRLARQIQQIVLEFIVKETVNHELLILQEIFIASFLNDYEEFKISSLPTVFLNQPNEIFTDVFLVFQADFLVVSEYLPV